jgi:imidazoleglycerol-phosphate dehydratase/histidinol-phosphatase
MSGQKILFIDRDGTLIAEPDDFQIDRFEKFRLQPGCIAALQKLREAGWTFVMVSNQDGLGTESFPLKDFEGPQNLLLQILESQGISFQEILICPHKPEDQCECRKPKIGLVKAYLEFGRIDSENSFVIGDRPTDAELAKNMGLKAFLYNEKTLGWDEIARKILLMKRARRALVERVTKETKIRVEVDLDDFGSSDIHTGIGFFDHMLDQIATHAGIRLKILADGDLRVDDHHTIEDVGLVLGEALKKALGDKRGIGRFGFVLPMDECLAQCALDLSNRPYLVYSAQFKYQKVGDMSTEMIEHFFRSLSQTLGCTLHLKTEGANDHHRAESLFKVFARALREAIAVKGNTLASSKGVLQ